MIYNFKDASEQMWVIDTESLSWSRASSIIAAPSIVAAESNVARFVPTEEGELTALGGGRYVLEGRKQFDDEGKPQLAIVIILTLLSADNDGTCVTFLQSNVEIKDAQHQQIKNFHTQCLAPFTPTPHGAAAPVPLANIGLKAAAKSA